ncbi:MAG TPA: hypothetical protein VE620_05740 [Myxococcales bacterium]|jgi:hypothetical protein|nr:hypothetical protein [Myxococcales bacterium]
MKTSHYRALPALALLAVCGCHSRVPVIGSAPTYHFRELSQEGVLGKKMDVQLSDDGEFYAGGIRYETPANGALIVTAKPVNAAVQIIINLFTEGGGMDPSAHADPGKKLEATDLSPGTYWVVVAQPWKEAVKTRVAVTTVFKPQDPELANGPYKLQAGARELPATGMVSDTVDYSAMKRTQFWKISITSGGLNLKFNPGMSNLTAEFISGQGAPEKIDPAIGLKKEKLVGGDYFVKVYANDAGDAGKYELSSTFVQGDVCENGGPACDIAGAEELKLPQDSKTADVDFNKAKAHHFYKAALKEKGRLTIVFKVLQPPRGSKVQALFKKSPDDEGDRLLGTSVTKDVDSPGDYFIQVTAPEAGTSAKYALQTIWQPANFISADMLEKATAGGCMLTVSAGTNHGVRAGAACTIVAGANTSPIDSCVVDQAFPNLSKVRPTGNCSKIPLQNVKVQISQ